MKKLDRSYGIIFILTTWLALSLAGCGEATAPLSPTAGATTEKGEQAMSFELSSPAFEPGQPIPEKYTCDGEDVSPPLRWSDLPAGTESLALIMDDPDAPMGVWDHWVVFNLPPDLAELPEQAELPPAAQQGRNSWKRTEYGGPCPPGGTHRYFFKLYALDTALGLAAGSTKQELHQAMQGHILAQAELMGTYSR